MQIAITRQVSRSISDCELTFLERTPIDIERARRQHRLYEAALRDLGLAILSLPEAQDHPDAVFVEDTALVLDEIAILTRPGAASRQQETASIRPILERFRSVLPIEAPATVDGGDLLLMGRRLYVGLGPRTNDAAIDQLQALLTPRGYDVRPVHFQGCLHLKSAATAVAADLILVNPAWLDLREFSDVENLDIDPSEPYAANAVRVDDSLLVAAEFPKTRRRLEEAGLHTVAVEADELAKAEAALSCCSLIFDV
jgi:dimethylargininase